MPTPTPPEIQLRITWTVVGLLAVAFMAWAGVVYWKSEDLLEGQQQILVEQARIQGALSQLDATLKNVLRDLERHEEAPWHTEAGTQIIELRGRANSHERRILNLEDGVEPR